MQITNKGRVSTVNALLTPPTAVGAVPPGALSGPVSVKATVADAAGNTASTTFAFTVAARAGQITAMTHTALQPLVPGAAFTVEMRATPGGQAALGVVVVGARAWVSNIGSGLAGLSAARQGPSRSSERELSGRQTLGGSDTEAGGCCPLPAMRR